MAEPTVPEQYLGKVNRLRRFLNDTESANALLTGVESSDLYLYEVFQKGYFIMKIYHQTLLTFILITSSIISFASESFTSSDEAINEYRAKFVQTPHTEQKVVFDFYFDDPGKIASALYQIRSHINTLSAEPYNIAPDFNDIKVVIHGTEIVTLARKNYKKYKTVVERMRYYAEFGVEFKVCKVAAKDYSYELDDFYEFVDLVPSSITELAHWQLQGYALITPKVPIKHYTIEEIR